MKQLNLVLFCSCLLSASVFAEQSFYAGAGIGQSYVEEDNVLAGEDFEEEDFAYKVYGGSRFHENLAVELAYLDFGEPDDNILGIDSEIDLSAFVLYLAGVFPLNEKFEVFAKLGAAYWEADVEAEFMGITASDDEDGTDLAYGLGASFSFTDQFAVRVEYEGIDVDDLDLADMLTLSGEVHF